MLVCLVCSPKNNYSDQDALPDDSLAKDVLLSGGSYEVKSGVLLRSKDVVNTRLYSKAQDSTLNPDVQCAVSFSESKFKNNADVSRYCHSQRSYLVR
jgi:hypothetical protein